MTPNNKNLDYRAAGRSRILIVEDESLVAEDLAQRLERLGYEVCARADTGEGAVNMARVHAPDMVLMDIHLLGEMDGVEAARKLREEAGPPVLFVTAHADDMTLQRTANTEPYGFVLKPFDERELKAAIETAFHRRRAEQRVMQIERKMQEAQRLESLGVIASGIAHDFNNLLHAITCNASLADAVPDDKELVKNCLAEIESTARRAAQLCSQMLAYAGQGRMQKAEIDLSDFTRDALHLANTGISRSATLHLRLDPGLPTINADRSQLQQVVMNLVINASEALDGPGDITISTRFEHLDDIFLSACHGHDGLQPGHYLVLEVTDTGTGMLPETRMRVFDPFFTTKFTGRGLGLAAVSGIVRSHEGGIAVRSNPGEGSTFTVVFPPSRTVLAEEPPTPSIRGWKSSGRILLADDELPLRVAGKSALQHFGFEVELAVNGRQTVDLVQADPTAYRALVLDLTMPVLDGGTAFQAIRASYPELPILLVSGYAEDRVRPLLEPGSPTLFLHKPFTISTLAIKIRQLLNE
ncbi:MAG: response regulator [Chthoniobacteraceae bacterium]